MGAISPYLEWVRKLRPGEVKDRQLPRTEPSGPTEVCDL